MKRTASTNLAAILFALNAGYLAALGAYYALKGVSSISGFSSGGLTSSGATDKGRDLVTAVVFVIAAIAAFILAYEILKWAGRRVTYKVSESAARAMIFSSIPACFALGNLMLSPGLGQRLVLFSLFGEALVLCCVLAHVLRQRPDINQGNLPRYIFEWVPLLLVFGTICGVAVVSAWGTLVIAFSGKVITSVGFGRSVEIAYGVGCGFTAVVCLALFLQPSSSGTQRGALLAFVVMQLVLFAGIARFIGPLVELDGQLTHLCRLSSPFVLALLTWMTVSCVRVIVETRQRLRLDSADWISRPVLSTLAAVLAATFLKINFDGPNLPLADDYHTGEFAVPYWAWKQFGLLPYVHLSPPRGWMNLIAGFIAEEGFGGGLGVYAHTAAITTLFLYALLFPALRLSIGALPALFIVCLAPISDGLSDIDVVNTALLALLCAASFRLSPSRWLILWVVLGTLAVLFAPGQGGLLVVSTSALGAARFISGVRTDWPSLRTASIALLVVGLGFVLLTPAAEMVFGAIRYALEQSSANVEANGISWRLGRYEIGHAAALWEIARDSWLFVTIGIGIVTYLGLRSAGRAWLKSPHFILGVPIVILGSLFVFRAGVRITDDWSRLGIASVWYITLMLPLYAFFAYQRVAITHVIGLTFLAGVVSPQVGAGWQVHGPVPPSVTSATLVAGVAAGLPQLRRTTLEPERVRNFASLKNYADSRLGKTGTYVDLTNRNTSYYVLDRPPAMATAAYNMTSVEQELRAIRQFEKERPKLALADSLTVLWDGGPLSLRANLVYRYFLEQYRPAESSGAIWLERVDGRAGLTELSDEEYSLLARAFFQRDLGNLPLAWGTAWSRLSKSLTSVTDISETMVSSPAIQDARGDKYGPLNDQKFIDFSLSDLRTDGRNMGLLIMDFDCSGQTSPILLQIFWINERFPNLSETNSFVLSAISGKRLIVPLDSAPSWVLGGRAKVLRVGRADSETLNTWKVSNVRLAQRANIDALYQLLSVRDGLRTR
jgi:hypothetical protein